jgi:hypothetical protein
MRSGGILTDVSGNVPDDCLACPQLFLQLPFF